MHSPIWHKNRILCALGALLLTIASASGKPPVRLTEVEWHGAGCYKIEMPMGTVYFEKDDGVSGFKSFIDPEGNDWIASYLPPGPNGDFRGFPNSVGNFGHAGRDSGSTTRIVGGRTEGDYVVLWSRPTPISHFNIGFSPTTSHQGAAIEG